MSTKPVRIIAYILIVIGLIGLAWSFQPTRGTTTAELPTGQGYYSYVKVSMWLNGHVEGNFEVASGGGTVRFFVFDSTQYEDYSHDGVGSDSMFTLTGASGSFSEDFPTTSTYYLVVDHGSTTAAQTVDITYKVSGLDIKYLIGGAVLLAVGAVLAVIGLRMKAKAKAATPPPAAQTQPTGEVVMFDKKT
jgi:hypothetical protein